MVGIASAASTLAGALLRPRVDQHQIALIGTHDELTYAQLNRRVQTRVADLDLADRSVVALTGDRSIEFVVTYLALLEGGHVPLLAGAHAERLASVWPVGAVVDASSDALSIEPTGLRTPELHPDLALLVSTSGSTGSPKLVRLSHRNLVSNAEAIGTSLGLDGADVGITSLPLHYCYGLSVLHSHLMVGGGVVVSEASVVDPCFRRALGQHGVTNVAGVPHTYELLERSDPEHLRTPSLRLLTQAGGRLAPSAVATWATLRSVVGSGLRGHVRPDRGDGPDRVPASRTRGSSPRIGRPTGARWFDRAAPGRWVA